MANVHIVPNAGRARWVVSQGGRHVSRHFTQRKAVKVGRRLARRRQVDLVTHRRDGRFRSKDSYGSETAVRDTEH